MLILLSSLLLLSQNIIIEGPDVIYSVKNTLLQEEEILRYFQVRNSPYILDSLILNAEEYYANYQTRGNYVCYVMVKDSDVKKEFVIANTERRNEIPHIENFTLTITLGENFDSLSLYQTLIDRHYLLNVPYGELIIENYQDINFSLIGKYEVDISFTSLDYSYREINFSFTLEIILPEEENPKSEFLLSLKDEIINLIELLSKLILSLIS